MGIPERIDEHRRRVAGRAAIIALTKGIDETRCIETVRQGIVDLAEVSIDERRAKQVDCSWHFVGHASPSHAREVVALFAVIHTLDKLRMAQAFDREAGKAGKRQQVLVQVNLSGERQRYGVSMEEAHHFCEIVHSMQHLQLLGLMAMPPFLDPERARPYYRCLHELHRIVDKRLGAPQLCMGLSHDYPVALDEGSTMVRLGLALYG